MSKITVITEPAAEADTLGLTGLSILNAWWPPAGGAAWRWEGVFPLAIRRFLALRARPQLRKPPATGELLVWLRVLSLALETEPARLAGLKTSDLKELPYLQVLLKNHRDQEELGEAR